MTAVRLSAVHVPFSTARPCVSCWPWAWEYGGRLTKGGQLLEPRQGVAPQHLPVGLGEVAHAVRVGEDEVVPQRLRRLPLLAVLGHQQAELRLVVDQRHVRRVVEQVGVRGRAEEEQAGGHGEVVETRALKSLAPGRGAGQQRWQQ